MAAAERNPMHAHDPMQVGSFVGHAGAVALLRLSRGGADLPAAMGGLDV